MIVGLCEGILMVDSKMFVSRHKNMMTPSLFDSNSAVDVALHCFTNVNLYIETPDLRGRRDERVRRAAYQDVSLVNHCP